MNKQKFTGIIFLMAISLLGIIAVQIFWMKKAISIKEQQFDQQVNQALSWASMRIERNQNANFYYMRNAAAQFQLRQAYNSNALNNLDDSVQAEFNNFWKDNSNTVHVSKNDKNVKVQKTEENGIVTINYVFDTVIADGNSTQRIQSYSQFSQPKNSDDSKFPAQIQSDNEKNKLKQDKWTETMDQMYLEFSFRNIPLEERLNNSIIGPTVEYELRNMNIPLKFEYAVANHQGTYYNKLKSKGFKPKKAQKAYKTSIFPSDINTSGDHLVIYFPAKQNYLINNMMWPFAGSLIFTLIILFTFYFTLRIIYNQKKVSEIKTDFINNMTHEFKTPIATISLAADAIGNQNILNFPEKVSHFIGIIKDENRRMNRQVESVLKMALIDKKDFNLNLKETNVHALIEQAIKNISLQVEQKGGTIEMNLTAENDLLRIDETHFGNLVFNLLDNANKYSLEAPSEIKVSTYNANQSFYLSIADKGIGMDKDTQERIFEKFYRVPTGNIHTVKGFGLGLSYVKAIVMQFKGDIAVESQKEKGSTFTIRIPLKRV